MVRNKLHWDANNAVGLPKQRNSYQSSPTFLCFESPTASFASWLVNSNFRRASRRDNFYSAWFSILICYTIHDSVLVCLLGVITSFVVDPCHSWLTVGTSAGMLVCWDLRFQLPITNLSHPRGNASVLWLTFKCWWCSYAHFAYRTVLFKRFQALVFVGLLLTRSSSPGSCLLCRATMKWPCGIWRLERGDRLCGQAIPHPYHKHRFDTPHPYHKHRFDSTCKSTSFCLT